MASTVGKTLISVYCALSNVKAFIKLSAMKERKTKTTFEAEESEFGDQDSRDIKAEEIGDLMRSRQNFTAFALSLGPAASSSFSEASHKYSKQIMAGKFDAQTIGYLLDSRIDKMLKNHKYKKNWCKEDCTIMAWILDKLTNGRHLRAPQKLKFSYWETVSGLIPGSTPDECMFKWLSMKKNKLENNKWSSAESKVLDKVVKQQGPEDWKKISRLLYLQYDADDKKYRQPKQCREQWNCYLNPALRKGPWTLEEDYELLKYVEAEGRKWSIIGKHIVGRTENSLKNRYNFLITHKRGQHPEQDQHQLLQLCLQQCKSRAEVVQPKLEEPEEPQVRSEQCLKSAGANLEESKLEPIQTSERLPEEVTIVECNYEQLRNLTRMNPVLIPARIERNYIISMNGDAETSIKIKLE